MVQAFVSGDFRIKYVQHYSDAQARWLQDIGYWAGWTDPCCSGWRCCGVRGHRVYTNRHRHREILPYGRAVMAAVADFFLYLIIFEKNPFDTFLVEVPASAKG